MISQSETALPVFLAAVRLLRADDFDDKASPRSHDKAMARRASGQKRTRHRTPAASNFLLTVIPLRHCARIAPGFFQVFGANKKPFVTPCYKRLYQVGATGFEPATF